MAEDRRWKNRIVGHGEESPDQLLANPKNWRLHPKEQQDVLAGVLNEVGWVQSVIVNKRTGHLIDGHLRVMLSLKEQAESVPVVYVDLSEEEEDLILATMDPISQLAGKDAEKLNELLEGVIPKVDEEKVSVFLETMMGKKKDRKDQPEVTFAQELLEEHQYIVLYFDNTIDWLNLQTLFPLPRVRALHHKGETYTATAVGRVIRGADFLGALERHFTSMAEKAGT